MTDETPHHTQVRVKLRHKAKRLTLFHVPPSHTEMPENFTKTKVQAEE